MRGNAMKTHALPRRAFAALLIAALVVALSAGTAFAYYTDTSKANGMIPFAYVPTTPGEDPEQPGPDPEPEPEPETELIETIHGSNKHIVVRNIGDVDAAVRVLIKYVEPDGVDVAVRPETADGQNSAWVYDETDDAWYYTKVLVPGESADALVVEVTPGENFEKLERPFDVIVIQQTATKLVADEQTGSIIGAQFGKSGQEKIWADLRADVPGGDAEDESSEESNGGGPADSADSEQ